MLSPQRWQWVEGDPQSLTWAWHELVNQGATYFADPAAVQDATTDPVALVERLLGGRVFRVRATPIEASAEGPPGFDSTQSKAPLHTLQDPYLPAHLQLLVCVRAARSGGDTLLADSWELAANAKVAHPNMYRSLFRTPRIITFNRSNCFGPTISTRLDSLITMLPAMAPRPQDQVGVALRDIADHTVPAAVAMEPGDVLVTNNHRMLQGRTRFEGFERLLIRVLVWLYQPLPAPPDMFEEAKVVETMLAQQLARYPEWVRNRFGLFGPQGLDAAVFQHDFSRLPVPPDAQDETKLAELATILKTLKLT